VDDRPGDKVGHTDGELVAVGTNGLSEGVEVVARPTGVREGVEVARPMGLREGAEVARPMGPREGVVVSGPNEGVKVARLFTGLIEGVDVARLTGLTGLREGEEEVLPLTPFCTHIGSMQIGTMCYL